MEVSVQIQSITALNSNKNGTNMNLSKIYTSIINNINILNYYISFKFDR